MGLGLMLRPDVYKPFLVSFQNHGDLPRAVEIARDLSLRGVIRNTPVVGHVLYMIAMKARRADLFHGDGSVTDEWITEFTRANHLGSERPGTPIAGEAQRRAWSRPRLDALPRLTELVLQTGGGIPGGGGTGGGGSTVIP